MKITYDKQTDALYISLKKGKFASNEEMENGAVLDIGTKGELLGLEILDASRYFSENKSLSRQSARVRRNAFPKVLRRTRSKVTAAIESRSVAA